VAIERINRVAGIADNEPSIRGIVLAGLIHVGAVRICVVEAAALHEIDDDGVLCGDVI